MKTFTNPDCKSKFFRVNPSLFQTTKNSFDLSRLAVKNLKNQENFMTPVPSGQNFKLKVPFFRKRPFGKRDSFNDVELNFIELDFNDPYHNLYAKESKFFKRACGRAYSVSSRSDRRRVSHRQTRLKLA